ncbi:hypothetical protein DMP17_22020 [Pseudonocardia sp. TMWB2A]|uniref:response regulator transcription factor n=1 Tax=Pseudonocardia sp. TMWB2A TaxID=687430 RepID=UPI00307EB0F8
MPTRATNAKKGDPLSHREEQVLRLLAAGLTNAEVGRQLYLTENTVKTYLRRVLIKLGALNRTQAVVVGVAMGHIPLPAGSVPVVEALVRPVEIPAVGA